MRVREIERVRRSGSDTARDLDRERKLRERKLREIERDRER